MEILYPLDYLPTPNTAQSAVINKFVSSLEDSAHVKRTLVSIAKLWEEHQPDGPENADISKYLETVRLPSY